MKGFSRIEIGLKIVRDREGFTHLMGHSRVERVSLSAKLPRREGR